jgi:hypothetical protein
MTQSIQLLNTTPEQLAQLINEGVKAQFLEFSKQFTLFSDPDVLLTRDETCKLLQIDSSTLWAWTNKGKLTAYGIANRRYYKKSEILASLQILKK